MNYQPQRITSGSTADLLAATIFWLAYVALLFVGTAAVLLQEACR